jgi:hypothetical protein
MNDDIGFERIRAARKAISEKCHNDITTLVHYYMALQERHRERLVNNVVSQPIELADRERLAKEAALAELERLKKELGRT